MGWDRFLAGAPGPGHFSEGVLGLVVFPETKKNLRQNTYGMPNGPTSMTTDLGGDISKVARAAIEYLMYHQPVVVVSFPEGDPPSQEMLRLLAPHVVGMEGEIAELVAQYLCQSLTPRLGLSGIEMG